MIRVVCCLNVWILLTAIASAQSCAVPHMVPPSCEAPSCVAPSCVAPSCVAPSCVAPSSICEGCVSDGCSQQAGCSCNGACRSGCQTCKSRSSHKPFINIDLSRTVHKCVNKKNSRWDALAEAPPQGVVAYSVPMLHANVASIPVSFGDASVASSSVDRELLRSLLEEARRERSAAAAAAAGTDNRCDDPCGQILQLKEDVDKLTKITQNLTLAVEKLASEHDEN